MPRQVGQYLQTLRELWRDGVTDPEILALLERHQATLEELLAVAPAQAAGGVQQAIEDAGNVTGRPSVGELAPPPNPAARCWPAPATGKP